MSGTRRQKPSSVATFYEHAKARPAGPVRELYEFLRFNKKWWLVPIIAVLLFVGALIALGSTAAAPFVYTLF
jgi:hypothetical protein